MSSQSSSSSSDRRPGKSAPSSPTSPCKTTAHAQTSLSSPSSPSAHRRNTAALASPSSPIPRASRTSSGSAILPSSPGGNPQGSTSSSPRFSAASSASDGDPAPQPSSPHDHTDVALIHSPLVCGIVCSLLCRLPVQLRTKAGRREFEGRVHGSLSAVLWQMFAQATSSGTRVWPNMDGRFNRSFEQSAAGGEEAGDAAAFPASRARITSNPAFLSLMATHSYQSEDFSSLEADFPRDPRATASRPGSVRAGGARFAMRVPPPRERAAEPFGHPAGEETLGGGHLRRRAVAVRAYENYRLLQGGDDDWQDAAA
ncbi:hypothetical protein BDK51DRAFT_49868 [Blyttiomyces helicus]|uniref:Uncharacterized protein n=1 Tax=Blyttiomyces helicus TaxID=388810 RepID=A0A4P9VXU6_9FUNG|nr:hypothetical protein BDK51DRAFT_49868 [Blyttiomyces helicus]|eukprot:RKO83543.1 hypothetical protein BDK51DRAFT_49868 [Blyttiomyces helicus]